MWVWDPPYENADEEEHVKQHYGCIHGLFCNAQRIEIIQKDGCEQGEVHHPSPVDDECRSLSFMWDHHCSHECDEHGELDGQ